MSGVGLFCLVQQIDLRGSANFYLRLRFMSIFVYFTHMFFVAGLSLMMKLGWARFGLYETWGILLALDVSFSYLLLRWSERPSGAWLRRLM